MKIKIFLQNSLLSCISVYLPLFFYSCYSTISFYFAPQIIASKKAQAEEHDMRTKALNEGYLPVFFPNTLKRYSQSEKIYPIGTLPFTNTYWCNEGYGLVKYKSDQFGLRNDNLKWTGISSKSNVFIIGDSYVHGACVPNINTISEQTQLLTNINTFNLGTGSNGPYEYMALIKNLVKPLVEKSKETNFVVLMFYSNDNWPSRLSDNTLLKDSIEIAKISKNGDAISTNNYNKKITNIIKSKYPISPQEFLEVRQDNSWKASPIYKTLTLSPFRKILKNIVDLPSDFSSPSLNAIELLAKTCTNKCTPLVAYIPNSTFWEPDNKSITIILKVRIVDRTF